MCDQWMSALKLPLTWEQFHRLPRNPAYKYEYFEDTAWLSPRARYYHALLDLAPLATSPLAGADAKAVLRPVAGADWEGLAPLFAAAFSSAVPTPRPASRGLTNTQVRCGRPSRRATASAGGGWRQW